jgi:DNA-binding response OmpR family regulator
MCVAANTVLPNSRAARNQSLGPGFFCREVDSLDVTHDFRGADMSLSIMLLLIEDEPLIIDVLEDALTDSGYEVVKSKTGTQALEEIEADASRFRAIVTDIKLGAGPDGWAIGQRAREVVPNMPIVYMSGDSAHEWASKGVPGSIILAKPFAPAQLVTAVSMLVTEADMQKPPAVDTETEND